MYLEIDEKTYFIHLKTDIDSIFLKKIEEEIIHLYVPAQLAQENLISYIRQELPRQISSYKKVLVSTIKELSVFDKVYSVKLDGSTIAYMKNEIIYADIRHFTTNTNIDKLKNTLLLNFINSNLSNLEEELNIILPTIILKKLKTKYYSICHTNEYITYSKTLIDKSKDFITYVIILAVGNFLKSSKEQVNDLINKYVSNPKHCERVYRYEQ